MARDRLIQVRRGGIATPQILIPPVTQDPLAWSSPFTPLPNPGQTISQAGQPAIDERKSAGVLFQMNMGIDESRQDRTAAQVYYRSGGGISELLRLSGPGDCPGLDEQGSDDRRGISSGMNAAFEQ